MQIRAGVPFYHRQLLQSPLQEEQNELIIFIHLFLRVQLLTLWFPLPRRPWSKRPEWGGGAEPSFFTLHSTLSHGFPACVEGEINLDPWHRLPLNFLRYDWKSAAGFIVDILLCSWEFMASMKVLWCSCRCRAGWFWSRLTFLRTLTGQVTKRQGWYRGEFWRKWMLYRSRRDCTSTGCRNIRKVRRFSLFLFCVFCPATFEEKVPLFWCIIPVLLHYLSSTYRIRKD